MCSASYIRAIHAHLAEAFLFLCQPILPYLFNLHLRPWFGNTVLDTVKGHYACHRQRLESLDISAQSCVSVSLEKAVFFLWQPLQVGKSKSWRNTVFIQPTVGMCQIRPQTHAKCWSGHSPLAQCTFFTCTIEIKFTIQQKLFFFFSLKKSKRQKTLEYRQYLESILDLTSLLLAFGTICIKICYHFYILCFRPSVMATFLVIRVLVWFYAPSAFLHKFHT